MNRVHCGPLRIGTGRASRSVRHSVPRLSPVAPVPIGPRVSDPVGPGTMAQPAVPLRARLNLLPLRRWPAASWVVRTR
jgi:hypothetical protein